MKTNEIKKGMIVEMRNGWFGIMGDNLKGNTRMVDVDGLYREMGSVYSHDIVAVWPDTKLELCAPIDSNSLNRVEIEHTPAQLKCKERDGNFW